MFTLDTLNDEVPEITYGFGFFIEPFDKQLIIRGNPMSSEEFICFLFQCANQWENESSHRRTRFFTMNDVTIKSADETAALCMFSILKILNSEDKEFDFDEFWNFYLDASGLGNLLEEGEYESDDSIGDEPDPEIKSRRTIEKFLDNYNGDIDDYVTGWLWREAGLGGEVDITSECPDGIEDHRLLCINYIKAKILGV
jgi:hypothetical protein